MDGKGRAPHGARGGNVRKLCIYGALNYATGQVHYLVHSKKNPRQFADFLEQLLIANRDRFLILVLDKGLLIDATYITTGAILDLLTEHEDHTFAVWLPKYSPELNAIEGLWGYLKSSALNNTFHGHLDALEDAIHDAFSELQQHPGTAMSLAYKTNKNLRETA